MREVATRRQTQSVTRMRIDADRGPVADALAGRREQISDRMLRGGAILLTGAGAVGAAGLAAVREALGLEPGHDREPFAARNDYGAGILSWPQWAPHREMCMHHERSYACDYPGVLLMGRAGVTAEPCEVLLADTREVLRLLPAALVARVRAEGWLLTRNFLPGLGLPWAQVLGADSPGQARAVCAERAIDCSFLPDGALRLSQRRAGVVAHPGTGDECWFNDLAFLSQWSVPAEERRVLLDAFGPHGMPFNTAFGSGQGLAESDFQAIIDVYDEVHVAVGLEPGDVLLADNVLMAHGRTARLGPWDVVTALVDRAWPSPQGLISPGAS